jgi:hypothetical protein
MACWTCHTVPQHLPARTPSGPQPHTPVTAALLIPGGDIHAVLLGEARHDLQLARTARAMLAGRSAVAAVAAVAAVVSLGGRPKRGEGKAVLVTQVTAFSHLHVNTNLPNVPPTCLVCKIYGDVALQAWLCNILRPPHTIAGGSVVAVGAVAAVAAELAGAAVATCRRRDGPGSEGGCWREQGGGSAC